jgi:ribonucleoside-triphosphate reductase
MKCPYCTSNETKVVDKRDTSDFDVSRRRRECTSCGKRFTTYERVESFDLVVIKSDGRRESFDKDKLKLSILKACDKRSVTEEQVDVIVNNIELTFKQSNENEVLTKTIGSLIMDGLRSVDKIAYLRYASVHLMFEDVDVFEHEIEKLRLLNTPAGEPPRMVKKRSGFLVDFDKAKIVKAIFKAAESIGGADQSLADHLGDEVVNLLSRKFPGGNPEVEAVQDAVEEVLIKNSHAKTAKAYILYRAEHKRLRESKSIFVDVNNTINDYLDQVDWRVKENSNTDYSFSGLMLHTAGKVIANYTLNEIYSQPIRDAHNNGFFHLHDLSCGVVGYCAGWSLKNLLTIGFGGVSNKVDTVPAKHMDVVVGQIVNFIGCLQMEFAGAQAFSSVDTLLAPFIKTDKLTFKQVKQNMQKLIFNLNIPSRWGSQMPFSNLTFDLIVPQDMKDEPAIVGGKKMDFTYGDCQPEVDIINTAFLEVMRDGDAKGRIFTFPIPTYNLTKNFDWDSPVANLLFEVTAKYGIPYFQNYIGSNLDPKSIRAMCCRLNLNLKELMNRPGGGFGAGDSTGSIGVVTININRMAYIAKGNKRKYFESLQHFMNLARDSLEMKRKVINRNLKNGLMPYTKVYLGSFRNHFSTIGICGMNEACINFLGKDISTPEGKAFAIETLNFMRELLKRYQQESGSLYNLEATPAEGASYRLARLDRKLHPDIHLSGNDYPFLTNSTQLPVDFTDDLFEALSHQNDIQPLYTGGTMFHTFLGERMTDGDSCKALVRKIAENTRLPYFSITPTFSICPIHGYIRGEHHTCPLMSDKQSSSIADAVMVSVKALKGGDVKDE